MSFPKQGMYWPIWGPGHSQFPDQVDDDLIALVRPQHGGQFHQGLASPFPDPGKILADGSRLERWVAIWKASSPWALA